MTASRITRTAETKTMSGNLTSRPTLSMALLLGVATIIAATPVANAQPKRADKTKPADKPKAAEPKVACEVLEISATQGETPSIPKSLEKLTKKLTRPPLASWNRFELMSSNTVSLAKMTPAAIGLSKGSAEILLREVDRNAGRRVRVTLGLTMNDASGRRVVDTKAALDAGDYFAVGYSLPNNDGHLIAISCR